MKVPYNYLPMQFDNTEKIFSDWKDLILTTEFTLGPAVEKFKKNLLALLAVNMLSVPIMAPMHLFLH